MAHLKTEGARCWAVSLTFDWRYICKTFNMALYKKSCDDFKMCKISGTCKAGVAVICCTVFMKTTAIQRKWQEKKSLHDLRGLSQTDRQTLRSEIQSLWRGYEHLLDVCDTTVESRGGKRVEVKRAAGQDCLGWLIGCHQPLTSSQSVTPQLTR